jgi:hypothetical protein
MQVTVNGYLNGLRMVSNDWGGIQPSKFAANTAVFEIGSVVKICQTLSGKLTAPSEAFYRQFCLCDLALMQPLR